jgi:hypothetical protein
MKYIIIIMFLFSCAERIKTVPINIGTYIQPKKTSINDFSFLMTSAGQLSPCINIAVNKISYQATTDSSNKINFLTTSDPLFSTSEGLKVNMTYAEVKKLFINNSEFYEAGWGYIIPLKSGWSCMFLDNYILNNSKICDTSKIKAFFKREKNF